MKLQIIVKERKVVGWGDGSASYSSPECATVEINITSEDKKKLDEGYRAEWDGQLILTKTPDIEEKERITARKGELRKKLKDNSITQQEIKEILSLIF